MNAAGGRIKLTQQELKQIIFIKSEIETLTRRKYKSSQFMSDYGYDHRGGGTEVITIQGYYAPMHYEASESLDARVKDLKELVLSAEEFISEIADAKIRIILTLRYIEGKSWREIAKRIYKKMTADAVRKYANRWFNENKK
jgi:DNA-directed RNA polymerase specialized sigma24 family protein